MNQFNFKAFNELTSNAGSGLKLHLALQMLRDVDYTMYRYKNPLQTDICALINELVVVQTKAKAQAAERKARTE